MSWPFIATKAYWVLLLSVFLKPPPMTATENTAMYPGIAQDMELSPSSKLWIYVAERPLTDAEQQQVNDALRQFASNWTAHNQALKARAELFVNQVVILCVDESQAGASGCSIDKSVHFLESLGQAIGVDFFDRMRFGWVDPTGMITFGSRDDLSTLRKKSLLPDDTLMLNTLAGNLHDLQENWLKPLNQSWHSRLI